MGRKPSVPKNTDKVPMAETPSVERAEPKHSNANITLPGVVDSKLENSNPRVSPLKYPNPCVDVAVTHTERSPALEQNQENGLQKKSAKYIRKRSTSFGSSVRRSERIKSAVVHSANSNRGIEYIDDESESERDEPMINEPVTQMEQVLSELEPEPTENLGEKRSDEKFEHVLQRIEALENITALLKSKVDEIYAVPSMASISYQGLYIESQKKVEALTAKLENALGKIEVYEKEHRVFVEVLDKMKDAVNASLVSNLAKATEAAVNASAQAIRTACSASKRKRNAQES